MRTQFWRFAYDEADLSDLLSSDRLVFPDLSRWPAARNRDADRLLDDIKDGHYILLANFDRIQNIGIVRGVGKVERSNRGDLSIIWKRPIPRWELFPNDPGGIFEWENEGVFSFDVNPAKRYKLAARVRKLFEED